MKKLLMCDLKYFLKRFMLSTGQDSKDLLLLVQARLDADHSWSNKDNVYWKPTKSRKNRVNSFINSDLNPIDNSLQHVTM